MSFELDQPSIKEQFELLMQENDLQAIRKFLDDQIISDVADLIYDNPDYEAQIIANMAINRAAAVFKILENHFSK